MKVIEKQSARTRKFVLHKGAGWPRWSPIHFLLPLLIAVCAIAAQPRAVAAISASAREELASSLAQLAHEVDALRHESATNALASSQLPDVEIFMKAVDWPLRYDEFRRSNDLAAARNLVKQGLERARQLRVGAAPWMTATGLVVRAYRSRLDGSIQPYGLVVPATFAADRTRPRRLDVWLHGRDNDLTELKFISDRQRSVGEFAPADTIVLHPYGRYCNAFKFAGEIDLFEALQDVKRRYPIDTQRVALRGFSMGGAGVWHLAAHHPDVWAVAAPGAGFAETAAYTGVNKAGVPPWEQTLWQLYDATDYAANFFNLPVVAYNGTEDKQRQAADVMENAMHAAGLTLPRVWGTNVGHKYTAEAKREVSKFVDDAVARGKDRLPQQVHFTTRTLRYNRGPGIELLGLDEHWREATLALDRTAGRITTANINCFAVEFRDEVSLAINGEKVIWPPLDEQRQKITFSRARDGHWQALAKRAPESELRKRPGLQGPIDDAFMESFLMVRPTGAAWQEATGTWTATALAKATNDWRAQFRGDVRTKDDRNVSDQDIAAHNLILWGDPESNRLMKRVANRLPIKWSRDRIQVGAKSFDAAKHILALVYPNPLNPRRYIVFNSGFTFAAAARGSNAQQTPKLPDYAIMDVGHGEEIVAAGFFDESWQLRTAPEN